MGIPVIFLIVPKKPFYIIECSGRGARFANGHDLGALDPALSLAKNDQKNESPIEIASGKGCQLSN